MTARAAASLAILLLATSLGAEEYTFGSFDDGRTIPDPGTLESTVEVPIDVLLTDVDVIVYLAHPWAADLELALRAPDGTEVPLFADCGDAGTLISSVAITIDDDTSAQMCTGGIPPYRGSYRSMTNAALESLAGKRSLGTWVLVVTDDEMFDQGWLADWYLRIVD